MRPFACFLWPLLFALLAPACTNPDFPHVWRLDGLRVLAISAEPASLKPGESATLSVLAVDEPQNRPLTFLWLGCPADPHNLDRGPCSNTNALENPDLLMEMLGNSPENIEYLGAGPQVQYSVSSELFSVFPENHPQRQVGTVGTVLLMVISDSLPPNPTELDIALLVQRAQEKDVDSLISIFRIPVREGGEPPNHNPVVSSLVVDDVPHNKSELLLLEEARKYSLNLVVPPESFETYVEITHAGTTSKKEALLASFFSTCGHLEERSFNFASSFRPTFSTPNGKNVGPCTASIHRLFAVVYDSRGGQAWLEQPFVVCQQNGPAPLIRHAALSASLLTLEGDNLEALAELRLGTQFLQHLPPPQNGRLHVPLNETLSAGSHALSFVDFSCRRHNYGVLNF